MYKKHNKNNIYSGFTLIELLVTISIISLLATVILATVGSVRSRAREAKVKTEVHEIQLALEEYNTEHGGYPNPNSESTPQFYCIGATDCLLAGNSISNALPESVAKNISNLASSFPLFAQNNTAFDESNRGYIYMSCGSGLQTCESNQAMLIYPIFSGNTITMVNAEVGSFRVVSDYTQSSGTGTCGVSGTDDCANYSNTAGACNYDVNGTGSTSGMCNCGGGSDNCSNYCNSDSGSDTCNYDVNGNGTCTYGCSIQLGNYFNPYCDMNSNCIYTSGGQGSGYYCQYQGTIYDSASYSYSTGNSGSCSCGTGNSGAGYYCPNQTYFDQTNYPYYSSYDTGYGCSYGNGWAGSGYYYCTNSAPYYDQTSYPYYSSYDTGYGCSYGNGWMGSGYYYCTNTAPYFDQTNYPYYSSYDTGYGCSYGNGWAGSGYYYCTSTYTGGNYSCAGTISTLCGSYYYDSYGCQNYTYGTCSWGNGNPGGCSGEPTISCGNQDMNSCNSVSGCNFNYDTNSCEGAVSMSCSSIYDQNTCQNYGCTYNTQTNDYCYDNGNNSCSQFGQDQCSSVSGCYWTSN